MASKKHDHTLVEGESTQRPTCGIVMPISEIDGCDEGHWVDVQNIVFESAENAGFQAKLVSTADDSGVIQKRIIQNLYDNDIVVCDVSGKNPNVMFELGMRLAFDRPTIVIKDDRTKYSFDTAPIEHLLYPRDLRYATIIDFKVNLSNKIKNTVKRANEDPEYTTFLKNFGQFKVAKIEEKEVSGQEIMLEELTALRRQMSMLRREIRGNARSVTGNIHHEREMYRERGDGRINICTGKRDFNSAVQFGMKSIETFEELTNFEIDDRGIDHYHVLFDSTEISRSRRSEIRQDLRSLLISMDD